MGKKTYDAEFKLKVVLESMQKDTTIEQIKAKYGLSNNAINSWRKQFRANAYLAFTSKPQKKKVTEEEKPEYLKSIIGDLTVENQILKKALSVWD